MRSMHCLCFCALYILAACASAQDRIRPATLADGPGSQLVGPTVADRVSPHYRFERHMLDAVDGRRHYRIEIAIPRAAAPNTGYPALYMLDGNAAMATLTDEDLAALARANPPVLVAIGYDVPTRNDVMSRAYDYTPPVLDEHAEPIVSPVVRGRVGGGADVFLQFITTQVKPLVHTRTAVDPKRESLWGHSYGGLFALYALFAQPQAFAHYVAGDPSFWWHDGALLHHWQRFDKTRASGKNLAILVGTKARNTATSANLSASARNNAAGVDRLKIGPEIVETLRQHGAQTLWQTFPQYGHGNMLRVSLEYALHPGDRNAGLK